MSDTVTMPRAEADHLHECKAALVEALTSLVRKVEVCAWPDLDKAREALDLAKEPT